MQDNIGRMLSFTKDNAPRNPAHWPVPEFGEEISKMVEIHLITHFLRVKASTEKCYFRASTCEPIPLVDSALSKWWNSRITDVKIKIVEFV